MDVRKHLRGLGWQGEGHSLGKHANGVKKPLLISHKTGLHGLGAKSQKEKQADQWWLNAFDNALKDIGTGKESALSKVKDNGGRGGLYGFFVRGVGLEGTFDGSITSSGTSTPAESACGKSTAVVTLSVGDVVGTSREATEKKRSKKSKSEKREKKDKKDKKRRREEDPVDSHQDEPEIKKTRSTTDDPSGDTETSKELKRSKKKRSKNTTPEPAPEDTRTTGPSTEPTSNVASEPELSTADKEARRKARAEKRVRKEEKRRAKEQTSESDQKSNKKDKKAKKSQSRPEDVK